MPSELQKKAEYYEKLLLQCNNKLAQCNNIVITKNSDLLSLSHEYVKTGRSFKEPNEYDINWIKSRIQNIDGATVDGFLDFCCKNNGGTNAINPV